MIRLNLSAEPSWVDLCDGVRVLCAPCTSAVIAAARQDPAVESIVLDGSSIIRMSIEDGAAADAAVERMVEGRETEIAIALAKAVGRRIILAWEGVGDLDGNPVEPSPAYIDALMDYFPAFEQWQVRVMGKALMVEAEKNVSALSPSGTSAGAIPTAEPAPPPVPTAQLG